MQKLSTGLLPPEKQEYSVETGSGVFRLDCVVHKYYKQNMKG